jgi:hypothetical protein
MLAAVATALLSGVLTIIFGILLFTLKYAIAQRDQEVNRRLGERESQSNEHSNDVKAVLERLRLEELKTVKMEGDLKLTNQAHDGLNNDIDDIKKTMITRQEFELRMTAIERMLQQILSQLQPSTRYSQGRFPSPASDPSIGDKDRR